MDDDEKVRRNVMAVGGLVVVSEWLGTPLSAVVDRLLFGSYTSTPHKVDPHHLWVAILATLLYFSARYWYSEERSAAYAELLDIQSVRHKRGIEHLLINSCRRFVATGRQPAIFTTELEPPAGHFQFADPVTGTPIPLQSLKLISITPLLPPIGPHLEGALSFEYRFMGSGVSGIGSTRDLAYAIRGGLRLKLASAAWSLAVIERPLTRLFVPICVLAVALIVAVRHLVAA